MGFLVHGTSSVDECIAAATEDEKADAEWWQQMVESVAEGITPTVESSLLNWLADYPAVFYRRPKEGHSLFETIQDTIFEWVVFQLQQYINDKYDFTWYTKE